mgnify:CR=1 FL=1
MTTPGAAFSLNGNTGTDGYTATAGGVVNLALIDGMHADVQSVVARVVSKSKGASALDELATDYVFPTPSTVLALTVPDEVSSWWVEVKINGGSSTRGVEPTWTANRIISTLGPSGIRKQVPGESIQFDAANGWGGAQNDLVDALDTYIPEPKRARDAVAAHWDVLKAATAATLPATARSIWSWLRSLARQGSLPVWRRPGRVSGCCSPTVPSPMPRSWPAAAAAWRCR